MVNCAESRKYEVSVMAEPLTLRQVRVVPSAAFQSPTPTTTAESADSDDVVSDGAPEPVVLVETPKPSLSRNW
jgi:hypothetical protein